jgi:GNAT superfamily N-acetyltransferase
MIVTKPGTDILTTLPDLPRWVEARGLLLSRRGFVVEIGDGCQLVCGRTDRLVVPVTFDLSPLLEAYALKEVPGAQILLQDVMLPSARHHLPDWNAEAVTVYTLTPDRARNWRLPLWPTMPLGPEQVTAATHVPAALRDELADAAARWPLWAATYDGHPMSFAYPLHATEGWFDIAVHTLEPVRGRGFGRAAAMGLVVDRMLQGLRPVWRAPHGNEAAHRLARRLGFEPVDLVWMMTRS